MLMVQIGVIQVNAYIKRKHNIGGSYDSGEIASADLEYMASEQARTSRLGRVALYRGAQMLGSPGEIDITRNKMTTSQTDLHSLCPHGSACWSACDSSSRTCARSSASMTKR